MCSNHYQLVLGTEPVQARAGTPGLLMERLSAPAPHGSYCTAMSPSRASATTAAWRGIRARPWVAWVSILAWVSGCSKSTGSHQVRRIHGRVTELARPSIAGDRFCHFSTQPCSPCVCLLLLLGCCSRRWVTVFIEKFFPFT